MILSALASYARHRLLDPVHGFLERALPPLGRHVDGNFRMVDLTDQLPERPAGDPPEQVEDGELDGGQRQPERDARCSES